MVLLSMIKRKKRMFNWLKKKDKRERVILHVVEEYSELLGARYEHEMHYSGERFRKELLHPKLNDAIWKNQVLVVDLDGAFGYACSFLDEAFGGLIRVDGEILKEIEPHLEIVSKEEPGLIEEITDYMKEASNV
jgi:hypothetical protein